MIAPANSLTLLRTLLAVGFVTTLRFACFGQEASRPDRGLMPNGSYSVSDIESINVLNGNVNLRIPLASLPPIAGGKLSWTVTAQYNSKVWNVTRYQQNDDPLSWAPYAINVPGVDGGWSIGKGYAILFRNVSDDFDRLWYPGNSNVPQWDLNLINNYQWWKVVLRMPDGSEHELRPTDYSSYIGGQDFLRGFYNLIPSGSPMRYHSVDGTYLFARITSTADWTVYLPDGTRVMQTPDWVQRIQDTNGNRIKIWADGNGTHYQDEQTLREIRLTYNPSGQGQYQVWYNTVTGLPQHIDINLGTTTVQGKLYSVQQPGCGQGMTEQLNPSPLEVVREIIFPQTQPGQAQRRFTFSYNSDTTTTATDNALFTCPGMSEPYTRTVSDGLGELSRMVTPSGGIVDYSYNYDGVHNFEPFGIGDYLSQDTITQKKLTHDGTIESWTYDIGDSFGIVTSPDGSVASEAAYCSLPNTPGCASDKSGLTFRSVRPFSKVERHWVNLMFSGADNRAPIGIIPFNPAVDKEYTTVTDAQGNNPRMSAKVSLFDYNGNVIQETFYDWFDPGLVTRDAVGVPTDVPAGATVLKVVNYSHYNQAATSTSGNVYAKRSVSTGVPLILNAPKETTLGSSIVRLSYDQQAYGVAPTVGNLTTKNVWDDLGSKWITNSTSYDLYGNVSTSTDGRGKVTQLFYEDSTHSLPTRVVVDPQNGTGTQTTLASYDFSTGLVTSQQDVNGQVSTIDYNNVLLGMIDPFGRPGFTEAPQISINGSNHKRRVTTTYIDSARQMIVETDLNAQNDKLLKTRTTTDQLGRPVLTEQTEDGTNYTISVRNAYLEMGRVTLTSSAMRGTAASTDSWTRVTKDTAGRVKEVATFGGATQPAWSGTSGIFTGAVTTDYNAQFTTVTDQASKQRRSEVDALGRLIHVDEPDDNGDLGSTSSPTRRTDYGYDVFGDLTTVTQGAQTRTFSYDSLSRLRTAVNPESGTVTYQYDDNGNLAVKTDARGVSAHFEYDALNRVTRRWYNNSNSVTATTHNNPALPSDVGATNEVKFYYDSQSLPASPPDYSRGTAIGRLVAQTYGSSNNGDYFGYDVLGRPTLKIQQTGTINYRMSAEYNLSAAITTLTYPSGRTVTHSYDNAGRLTAFSGNLGDGTTRTYATGILYSPSGALVKEQFGTTTPVYNKLFYNSRGQLAEFRASTSYTGPTDYDWNRGAIINSYSDQCTGICSDSSMPDNNGNLKRQNIHIPDGQTRFQEYSYDPLNRLKSAREVLSGVEQWKQQFTYDRWGNRLIDTANTYGLGINNMSFEKLDAKNQLFAPGDVNLPDAQRRIRYDATGNQIKDTYTGYGSATFDAENHITAIQNNQSGSSSYVYDASGQRIKRTSGGVETWQVYGFGGELVAEYGANGVPASPQKEYGYRNGQLLVTANALPRLNMAASANGGIATASQTNGAPYAPSGAINGDRKYYTNNAWANSTATFPQWLQVDFNGGKVIDEIDVFSIQDLAGSPSEPTLSMTFSTYGLTAFEAQYWNGSAWVTVPGGSLSGNNKVWKQITFAPVTTSKIRVWITGSSDGYSRVAEVEAWGTSVPVTRQNVAASANGGTATASETNSAPYAPSGAINGDRKYYTNNAWANWTATFPQWLQVDFNGGKVIDEIDVFSIQDLAGSPSEPTLSMTFSTYGLTAFEAQYWNGSAWVTVPGGSVSGNNNVWKQITFASITTDKIRIWITGSSDGYSRLAEVEAWDLPSGSGNSGPTIQWLITDQLGTPRMVFDQTGSVASTKRHDYLPFGEELFAPTGGRTTAQGYAGGDGVRQQFTQKERDVETGLDYFLARYYSSTQGRFTSPDEFKGGPEELFGDVDPHDPLFYADTAEPQSLNKYHYCLNNPLRYIDPDGHQTSLADKIRNAAATVREAAATVARAAEPVINGASSAWAEDNGLGGNPGPQSSVGRGIGHAVALAQSGAEIVVGAGAAVGGGAEAIATSPAVVTIVGAAAPAVGVAVTVGGVVTAAHGVLVGANTVNNIFNKNAAGQSSGSSEKPKAEPPKRDRSVEGTQVQRENIERAQKVNRRAGRPDRIRSIEKSKQDERNALKKIKSLKDAENQ
jgi:RHS repeat-associated protein